jgi:four helix bundle protein
MKTNGPKTGSTEQAAGRNNGATFENLQVWQEAVELAARVYTIFHACGDFSFRDQVRRAAVSVSSNIAEGYERDSNIEFIRFLFIAKASCGEVRSQTYVARKVQLIADPSATELIEQARQLSRRIQRLIEVRREKFI